MDCRRCERNKRLKWVAQEEARVIRGRFLALLDGLGVKDASAVLNMTPEFLRVFGEAVAKEIPAE